jgi:diguanylate cyclase (GGDEF)-like protein/PAS domain S-box-containing protein
MEAGKTSAARRMKLSARAHVQMTVAAAAIALCGIGVAAWTAQKLDEAIVEESADQFAQVAGRIRNTLEQRFRTPVYGLRGLRSTFAAAGDLTRDQFHAWVAARDLAVEFPGVRAFGYAEHVYRWATVRFLERTRRDGAPDFAIRSQGDAPDLYVVKYIEPYNSFAPILGVDIGAEIVRRTAIDAAIETGEAALTAPIGLMGMGGQQVPGFLIVLAVYEGGQVPATVAERRAAVRGVLYAPLTIEELVGEVASASGQLVEFDLFDGLPDGTTEPFFSFRSPGSTVPVQATAPSVSPTAFLPVVIANRLVAVRAWPSQRWLAGVDHSAPISAGAAIAAFSVALAFAVWLLATGRARAVALARSMTADLDRLAAVAQRTTNGVIIADTARRIVWVNEGFTRLTGYSAAEAIGRKPRELVQFEGTSTENDAEMRRCLEANLPYRGEIHNRAKDGRLYWVDLEIRPMFDAAGGLTGFMAIQSDVTERREVLERLEAQQAELRTALADAQEARERTELQAAEMAALAEQLAGERQRAELSHSRLKEAVESLPDAFCLYDPDERVVMFNSRYAAGLGSFSETLSPGASYELIVRLGVAHGFYAAAAGREEDFVREHLEAFRNPPPPYEARSADGRWFRLARIKTPTGHTVSFRTDITELKEKEAALAKLNFELERLATTDALTGVPNRRSLIERGEAELARLKRYDGATALLALDIDHFKRVNDTHGHAAGDRVLVEFAARVRACLRETDIFGRIGGEEFAIVAPNTDVAGARLLGERLLEFVRQQPVEYEGTPIRITTSVGISMLGKNDPDLAAAQGRADQALYSAKRNGRNRLEVG